MIGNMKMQQVFLQAKCQSCCVTNSIKTPKDTQILTLHAFNT